MTNLTLAPTARYFDSGLDDYAVLEGRSSDRTHMLDPQGTQWFWTISAMEHPRCVYNRGYCATREQRWLISKREVCVTALFD
jgi:hypothetical protein